MVAGTEQGLERSSVDEEFLAIVCADEELLRAEFDAIIAESWDSPPPRPPARRPAALPPSGPKSVDADAVSPARPDVSNVSGWARQRSAPRAAVAR